MESLFPKSKNISSVLFLFIRNIILLCIKINVMIIGNEIKRLRKELSPDKTQGQFAESVGITQSYLSLIESGKKNPETALLKKIADQLNVPLPIIFWYSMKENDIPIAKRELFRLLKPIMDKLISGIFSE